MTDMEKVKIHGVPETCCRLCLPGRYMKEKSIEASKARFTWGLKSGKELESMVSGLTWSRM